MNNRSKTTLRKIYKGIPFKRRLYIILRAFYKPPEHIYRHLYFQGQFITDIEGHRFSMNNPNASLETSIFWSGPLGYEQHSLSTWCQLVQKSKVILDIGANTGLYSLVAKALNPTAKIFSFEPVTRIYQKLVQNCRLNAYDIQCEDCALSNQDGRSVIFDLPESHHYHASLNRSEVIHLSERLIEQPVTLKTLHTFIDQNKLTNIDLMKIDVEGHEAAVLQGMKEYLQAFRPSLIVEIKTTAAAQEIASCVSDLGYLYFDIDEVNGIKSVDKIAKSSEWNFLICTKQNAERLGIG